MKYFITTLFCIFSIICIAQEEQIKVGGGNLNDLLLISSNSNEQFMFGDIQEEANFYLQIWEVIDGEQTTESANIADLKESIKMKTTPKTILLLVPSKDNEVLKIRKMIPGQSMSVIPIKPAIKEKWDFKSFSADLSLMNTKTPFLLIYDTEKITDKERFDIIVSQMSTTNQTFENLLNDFSSCINHYLILTYLYETL